MNATRTSMRTPSHTTPSHTAALRTATLIAATTATLVLSGCAGGSGTAIWKNDTAEGLDKVYGIGKPAYGHVFRVSPINAKKACPDAGPVICSNPDAWRLVWMDTHTKYGFVYKAVINAPASAGVQEGDIVEFRTFGTHKVETFTEQFIRIASRKDSPNRKTCDWSGSLLLSVGGVVCDGYHYKSLPHFTR